jgi:hypothetical protein
MSPLISSMDLGRIVASTIFGANQHNMTVRLEQRRFQATILKGADGCIVAEVMPSCVTDSVCRTRIFIVIVDRTYFQIAEQLLPEEAIKKEVGLRGW